MFRLFGFFFFCALPLLCSGCNSPEQKTHSAPSTTDRTTTLGQGLEKAEQLNDQAETRNNEVENQADELFSEE